MEAMLLATLHRVSQVKREDKVEEEGEELEASVKSNEATSADEMIRWTVKEMIKDATNSTERSATYCQTLIAELKDNKHKTIVREMVKQMGGKVAKMAKTNCMYVLQWLEAEPHHHPFMFLTVNELKVCTSLLLYLSGLWSLTLICFWCVLFIV